MSPDGPGPAEVPWTAVDSMAEMLDPGLEHLHRHGRLWRWTTERRQLARELQLDVLSLGVVVLLFVLAPRSGWGSPLAVGLVMAACVFASLVRFEIGSGSSSPLVIVAVPLWYLVPPAWLPVVGGAIFAVGRLIERQLESERAGFLRTVQGASDAATWVAPAAVVALLGPLRPSPDGFGEFAIALIAFLLFDAVMCLGGSWYVHGIKPRVQLRLVAWIAAVDLALAPVGFFGAVVVHGAPWAILGLLPLVAVLGQFARERRDRLDQAVQLSSAYRGTAQLMGDVLEADHEYTGGEHTQGVVELAIAVGLELRLEPRAMRDLEFGALLHDIGKLRVPNEIINKPGSLTDGEWEVMRRHPVYGQQMLDRVGGALTEAGRIVRAHHERWDGSGYPDGLVGDAIPIEARIITACDSFSAMTTKRSYSGARTVTEAIGELERCTGTQFDPAVVAALNHVVVDAKSFAARQPGPSDGLPAAARALGLRTSPS